MAQSKGELKIADILQMAGLKYEIEYVFDDLIASSNKPLRFDFAVFDDDGNIWFLIEYQGEQHYKPVAHYGGSKALQRQKHNDRKKVMYCQDNNIPLLVIDFHDYPILDYDYIINKVNFM